ncbi:MAG: ABC transporter ATP-binding protein [Anaerolineales bacterium]|jgi:oligopeptide/dipeptide ABC transporter ATP-binding protein
MKPLLRVEKLAKYFPLRGGIFGRRIGWLRAVDGISFEVRAGETVGLVGESGSGKSTVGRTILRLLKPTHGRVCFDGQAIDSLAGAKLRRYRRSVQMIFQNPLGALDPRMSVEACVAEGLHIHQVDDRSTRTEIVLDAIQRVGLDESLLNRRPGELSAGQRQRIGIARALVLKPRFIVADEPVSALDVSVQAQVLNLLEDLQRDLGLTYLLIAHNLRVVEHISDRIIVMYMGRIVEKASTEALFERPKHPYTRALLEAIPSLEHQPAEPWIDVMGERPSRAHPPSGCRFHPRCPIAQADCSQVDPALESIDEGHWVACRYWDQLTD